MNINRFEKYYRLKELVEEAEDMADEYLSGLSLSDLYLELCKEIKSMTDGPDTIIGKIDALRDLDNRISRYKTQEYLKIQSDIIKIESALEAVSEKAKKVLVDEIVSLENREIGIAGAGCPWEFVEDKIDSWEAERYKITEELEEL